MQSGLITAASVVIVAIFTFLGGIYANKAASRTADGENQVKNRQEDRETFVAMITTLRTDLNETRMDLQGTKGELRDTRAELRATKNELAETRSELGQTQAQARGTLQLLNQTNDRLRSVRDICREALDHVNDLRAFIHEHSIGEIPSLPDKLHPENLGILDQEDL